MDRLTSIFDDNALTISSNNVSDVVKKFCELITKTTSQESDTDVVMFIFRKILEGQDIDTKISSITQILDSIDKHTKKYKDENHKWCEQQMAKILASSDTSEEQIITICTYIDNVHSKSLVNGCIEAVIDGYKALSTDPLKAQTYVLRYLVLGTVSPSLKFYDKLLNSFKLILDHNFIDDLLKLYVDQILDKLDDTYTDTLEISDGNFDWLYVNGSQFLQNFIEVTVQNFLYNSKKHSDLLLYFVKKICGYAYDHTMTVCGEEKTDGKVVDTKTNTDQCSTCAVNVHTLLLLLSRNNDKNLDITSSLSHIFQNYDIDDKTIKIALDNLHFTMYRDDHTIKMCSKAVKTIEQYVPDAVRRHITKIHVLTHMLKSITDRKNSDMDRKKCCKRVKRSDKLVDYAKWLIEKDFLDTKDICTKYLVTLTETQPCMLCINDTLCALKTCEHPICKECFFLGMYFNSKYTDDNEFVCHTCKFLKNVTTKRYDSDGEEEEIEAEEYRPKKRSTKKPKKKYYSDDEESDYSDYSESDSDMSDSDDDC